MNHIILIDKPEGMTSHRVVEIVRKRLGAKKAGHTGTLDPMACGLLVVCLGEATKLAGFLAQDRKEYEAVIALGLQTDTWDREGRALLERAPEKDKKRIQSALCRFRGRITQVVPAYSAVKHQGKPLYSWTRKGIEVALPTREVEIYNLEFLGYESPYLSLRVECSKGTYIRSLGHEIGEVLGCGASLWSLRRTRSGVFSLLDAVNLDRLADPAFVPGDGCLIAPADALPMAPEVELDASVAGRLRLGRQLVVGDLLNIHIPLFAKGDMLKLTVKGRLLLAVAETLYGSEELERLSPDAQVAKTLRLFNL